MQAIGRVVAGQVPEYVIRPILVISAISVIHFAGALTSVTAMAATVAGCAVALAVGAVILRAALPPRIAAAEPELRRGRGYEPHSR